jgi:nitrogen fixation-related uncharacterized protein
MKKIIGNRSYSRIVLVLGALTLALVPSQALAHDNVGGDELAVASWMLVAAIVTVVIGILWAIWAAQDGQFKNIEASKYTMLDTADDYDAIMAEYDAQVTEAEEAEVAPIPNSTLSTESPEAITSTPKPGNKTLTSNT